MTTDVIAIFDIGKTNKKLLLFNKDLKLISQVEEKFAEITDEDNFSCDDIEKIEAWMTQSVKSIQENSTYNLKAINFSTYGASLVYIDEKGNRLAPIYNYLKPMPADILPGFYEKYGGVIEFSRKTASPALEMLNSGLQILWFKRKKKKLYNRVSTILHFPQYLSYLFSKKITSEYTSLGCHTALWNFDDHCYHQWLTDEKIKLPEPVANDTTFEINFNNHNLLIGIGIHDSSSALVPYLEASTEPFVLVSTGTWCIIMNPFNDEPLTKEQLSKDALCYMSTLEKQVKSSRVFMGHLHDIYAKHIADYFKIPVNSYKAICASEQIIKQLISLSTSKSVFFNDDRINETIDIKVDYSQFSSYEEAYHQLVFELTLLVINALNLVLPKNDSTQCIYITGGFARNEIFVRSLATLLPNKKLFTSEIDNASALGAAMVIRHKAFFGDAPKFKLGLKKVEAFTIQKQSEYIQDLIKISQFYGKDKRFVIAGGGNTSFKHKDNIRVKASGSSLATITESGFAVLDREKLNIISEKIYSINSAEREEQVKNDLAEATLTKGKRPSVETSIHNIIDYPFVVHLHPTSVNGLMCANNAEKKLYKLFGNQALFIPYTDPGYVLFKSVEKAIKTYRLQYGNEPSVIWLQNHGIFVAANTIEEIKDIYDSIIDKLEQRFNYLPENDINNSINNVDEILSALQRIFTDKALRIRDNGLIQYFNNTQNWLSISKPFTPDAIVYCKSNYLFLNAIKPKEIADEAVKHVSAFFNQFGYNPKVILIKGIGILAVGDNGLQCEIVLDVFEDALKIAYLSQSFGGPHPLTQAQISFIDNWEVENYRRSVSS